MSLIKCFSLSIGLATCAGALCPFPGLPAFGTVNDSISWANRRPFTAGERIQVTCPEWVASKSIVCQGDGQWSGPMPQCSITATLRGFFLSENNCGWPPIPLDGDIASHFTVRQSTAAAYRCHHNLVIDPNGPQRSTCDPKTGQWSPLPRCVCPEIRAADVNVIRTDVALRFSCGQGLQLIGNDTFACNAPGHLEMPICQKLHRNSIFVAFAVISASSVLVIVAILLLWKLRSSDPAKPLLANLHLFADKSNVENFYSAPVQVDQLNEPIYEELHFDKADDIAAQEPIYFIMEPKTKPLERRSCTEFQPIMNSYEDASHSIYVEWMPQDTN